MFKLVMSLPVSGDISLSQFGSVSIFWWIEARCTKIHRTASIIKSDPVKMSVERLRYLGKEDHEVEYLVKALTVSPHFFYLKRTINIVISLERKVEGNECGF